ncbi:cytidine deaminase-like protein [Teratosphaeria destructans]|uniref:Cytidine deaminase-like protein n=1 Tax=Teratosphaeria destructans TaxID=418781 RepID=A0A9W7SU19_9PEZI|nr:cytidine deaminase-like protein [Teratosphaeria destructans]
MHRLVPFLAATATVFANREQHVFHQDSSQIPTTEREHWMRTAISALDTLTSPCPFAAFGTAIVNHSSTGESNLICIGANAIGSTGNPTLHGEIAGIDNCSSILTDPKGRFKLPAAEALQAYRDLSLYTTAEPCPMCASAIRWAGFKECIFGTRIPTLIDLGWDQIDFSTEHLFRHSGSLGTETTLMGGVLEDETDVLLAWQFRHDRRCPLGCQRSGDGGACLPDPEAAREQWPEEL